MGIADVHPAGECGEQLAEFLSSYWDQTDEWIYGHQKLFEQRFDAEELGVFRVSPGGVIRDSNAAAAALLGYSRHELIGMPVGALYAPTPDGRQKASGLFRRFTAGDGFCGEVMEMQRKDGSPAWTSLCVRVVEDSSGAVRESLSVMREAEPLAP